MHARVGGKIANGHGLPSALNPRKDGGGGDDVECVNGRKANAAPGGSVMVAGYDKNGNRLTGLKNISKSNG